MHVTEPGLTRDTYDYDAVSTPNGQHFMDCPITADAVNDGTLAQRFDPIAYPQSGDLTGVGVTYAGTDNDGNDVPAPATSALF